MLLSPLVTLRPFAALRVNSAKGLARGPDTIFDMEELSVVMLSAAMDLARWVPRCFPFASLRASAHALSMTTWRGSPSLLTGEVLSQMPGSGWILDNSEPGGLYYS